MKNIEETRRDLNARFIPAGDAKNEWKILKHTGWIYGDCEDYACTFVWLASGKSMLKFWWNLITRRASLWYCKAPVGGGHVVLDVKGHGCIDSLQYGFRTRAKLEDLGYTGFRRYRAASVALKFLRS